MNIASEYQVSSAKNIKLTDNSTEGCALKFHIRCSHNINLEFGDIYQAFLTYPYFITHQFIYFLNLITVRSKNAEMQR